MIGDAACQLFKVPLRHASADLSAHVSPHAYRESLCRARSSAKGAGAAPRMRIYMFARLSCETCQKSHDPWVNVDCFSLEEFSVPSTPRLACFTALSEGVANFFFGRNDVLRYVGAWRAGNPRKPSDPPRVSVEIILSDPWSWLSFFTNSFFEQFIHDK